MNILIDQLPTCVEIDGQEYNLNIDFRVCLRIIQAFEDNGLTGNEKQFILLNLLYENVPDNIPDAIKYGLKFLNGGQDESDGQNDNDPMRLFSFAKDANLIFAAFRQTHNIDLENAYLHWWIFLALFMDLGSNTAFCNLVALRKRVKTGVATKEERKAAVEMGDLFEIPDVDMRTLEEKEYEQVFMQKLHGIK